MVRWMRFPSKAQLGSEDAHQTRRVRISDGAHTETYVTLGKRKRNTVWCDVYTS
jgi:hypothetical protein